MLISVSRNNPHRGILLRLNGNLKLNTVHHTGGGKQANIPIKQTIEANLSSFIGKNIGTKLSASYQQKTSTLHSSIVNHGPFVHFS